MNIMAIIITLLLNMVVLASLTTSFIEGTDIPKTTIFLIFISFIGIFYITYLLSMEIAVLIM